MLYNSVILPLFDYCDGIFGKVNVFHLGHIHKLQTNGAGTIHGLDRQSCVRYVERIKMA